MKKFTVAFLAIMALLTGCKRDDTLLHGDITMGNVISGRILTDQGLFYNVVEQICEGRLDTMNRVLIACDILEKTGDKDYNVRLTSLVKPIYKKALKLQAAEAENLGHDPAGIGTCWSANGHINMQFRIYMQEASKTPHNLNLVLNASVNNADTLHFILSHDAYGEYLGAKSIRPGNGEFVSKRGYASFQVSELIPVGKTSIPAVVTTHWHTSFDSGVVLTETTDISYKMEVSR